MTACESQRLHHSDDIRAAAAGTLAGRFELHLRGSAPGLASAIEHAALTLGKPTSTIVIDGIMAVMDHQDTAGAVAAFDSLRQSGASVPHQDALLGHALLMTLEAVLGPAFDEATREAWVGAYIRLVETVMSGRRNRFDLVA